MEGSRRDTQIGVPVQRVVDIAPAARLAGPLIASAEFDFDLGPEVSRVLKGVGIGEQKGHFFSRFCGRLQTPSGLTNHGCKTLGHAWNYLGRDFVLNRFPELFIELLPLRLGQILIGQVTLAGKPEGGTIQRDVSPMSSENRWISRKTFEREVPPLKHIWGTPWREKRWRSVQQTQKSFSNASTLLYPSIGVPRVATPALLASACMGIPRIQIVLARLNTETFIYRSEFLRAAAAALRGLSTFTLFAAGNGP